MAVTGSADTETTATICRDPNHGEPEVEPTTPGMYACWCPTCGFLAHLTLWIGPSGTSGRCTTAA